MLINQLYNGYRLRLRAGRYTYTDSTLYTFDLWQAAVDEVKTTEELHRQGVAVGNFTWKTALREACAKRKVLGLVLSSMLDGVNPNISEHRARALVAPRLATQEV